MHNYAKMYDTCHLTTRQEHIMALKRLICRTIGVSEISINQLDYNIKLIANSAHLSIDHAVDNGICAFLLREQVKNVIIVIDCEKVRNQKYGSMPKERQ